MEDNEKVYNFYFVFVCFGEMRPKKTLVINITSPTSPGGTGFLFVLLLLERIRSIP
jgi:hypothetical protein